MLELVRKSLLAGAGLTLLTADKVKELVESLIREGDMTEEEARVALHDLIDRTEKSQKILEEKKKKLLNDAYAFWLYGVLSDEIEERLEKAVSATLEQLRVPRNQELKEIAERIERLENGLAKP